jgi:hypothetical protein
MLQDGDRNCKAHLAVVRGPSKKSRGVTASRGWLEERLGRSTDLLKRRIIYAPDHGPLTIERTPYDDE